MASYSVVRKVTTETDVFNDLRLVLSNSDLEVLQLVPPGGQAPLSLTYIPNSAERPKTVYPDLIAFKNNSIYLGELKPRFSKPDVEKLRNIQGSADAYEKVCRIVRKMGKAPLSKTPTVVLLLVHTQEVTPKVDGIVQVVFLETDGIVLLGDNKAAFDRETSSIESMISSVNY
jgi:hypothetical protein